MCGINKFSTGIDFRVIGYMLIKEIEQFGLLINQLTTNSHKLCGKVYMYFLSQGEDEENGEALMGGGKSFEPQSQREKVLTYTTHFRDNTLFIQNIYQRLLLSQSLF